MTARQFWGRLTVVFNMGMWILIFSNAPFWAGLISAGLAFIALNRWLTHAEIEVNTDE